MSSDSKSSPKPSTSGKRRIFRRLFYVVTGAAVLYVALGFFAVPPIVRAVLTSQVEANLNARVQLEAVAFNPFTLRLRLEGLSLRDPDDAEILHLGEGQFALSLASIRELAPVAREVLLSDAAIFVSRDSEGILNLAGLLKEKTEEAETAEGLPKIAVQRFALSGGKFEFSDDFLPEPFSYSWSPISFELSDFSTFGEEENQLRFDATDSNGAVAAGDGSISFEPMGAAAQVQLDDFDLAAFAPYVREFVEVEVREGMVDLNLAVSLRLDSREEMLDGLLSSLVVSNLVFSSAKTDGNFLEVGRFEITDAAFGAWDPWVKVTSVDLADGKARVRRLADGSIDLLSLLPAPGSEVAGAVASGEATNGLPLSFSVNRFGVESFQFEAEDLVTGDEARMEVFLERAEVRSITENFAKSVPFEAEGLVAGEGRFRVAGEAAPDPLKGTVEVAFEEIPLTPLNPWMGMFVDLSVGSGTADLSGELEFAAGPEGLPVLSFQGETGMANFEAREGDQAVVKFERFHVADLTLQSEPLVVTTGLVGLERPEAVVVLESDGNLNLLRLLRLNGPAEEGETAPAEASQSDEAGPDALPLRFTVGAIEVAGGLVSVSDQTITPSYSTRLGEIALQITDLDSKPESRASVDFSGRFPDSSRLVISGLTNAYAENLFADMNVRLIDFGLTPVSPYSGQFIGRAVATGSLNLEVTAMIDEQKLTTRNVILLKDLRLGDQVESPSAPSLPLDLALALLRDRRGEISIDLPIAGQVDDPQFNIAAVGAQAFFSVIRNVATSPFAALGNLVGARAEQLSEVEFSPGQFTLSPDNQKAMGELSEALYQRPALKLEARGAADPILDRPALVERRLLEKLVAHRDAASDTDTAQAAGGEELLQDEELVRSYYNHLFPPVELPDEPEQELSEGTASEMVETATEVEVGVEVAVPATEVEVGEVEVDERVNEPAEVEAEDGKEDERWFAVRFVDWLFLPIREGEEKGEEQEIKAGDAIADVEPVAVEEQIESAGANEAPGVTADVAAELEPVPPVVELPSLAEMRERLLETIEVGEDDFYALGKARAEAVRDALLESGQVEEDRVMLGAVALEAGLKVRFEVR